MRHGRRRDAADDTRRNTPAPARGAPETDAADAVTPGRIATETIYDGRIVHLSIDTVRFPDGSTGRLEMIRHSGASAVLPILEEGEDPLIVLLRQYRYAADGYLFEIPAGRPEWTGEAWSDCARRELEEEAGLIPERLVPLTTIYTTPGFTDERIHLFLALGVRPGTRTLDSDEFLEPVSLRLSEALARIRTGEIVDAKTICTLHCAAEYLRHTARSLSTSARNLSSEGDT
ncbi:MAG TPA: NUDIX hydrolase [Longimicrobiales bacterium]